MDLGNDTGGGDRQTQGVSLNDGLVGDGKGSQRPSVDECGGRADGEADEGALHGRVVGLLQPHGIEFVSWNHRPTVMNRRVVDQLIEKPFALLSRQFLGVVEPREAELRGENDGSGDDRTRPRAAPDLINLATIS